MTLDLTDAYASGWLLSNLMDQTLTNGPTSWFAVLTRFDNRFTCRAGKGSTPNEALAAALAAPDKIYNWREPEEATGTGRLSLSALGLTRAADPINRRM